MKVTFLRVLTVTCGLCVLLGCAVDQAGKNKTGFVGKVGKNTKAENPSSDDSVQERQSGPNTTAPVTQPSSGGSTQATPAAETPSQAQTPNTCYVDDEAAIHQDLTGLAPKAFHYNNLALDLEFNSDAFDFNVALIQVVVDDGKPVIQISGRNVFRSDDCCSARVYTMNVPLTLNAGKNLVQGSFYDEQGQDAKLSIKLRGTWKTYQSCFKDFSHRYKL